MNHSQKMSEKPLTPWVICEGTGKIITGHCDCMAGLGESCSHVASLLWAIEAGVKQRDSLTVTDKKAYWVLPPAVKTVPYAKVKDINFFKTPTGSAGESRACCIANKTPTKVVSCPTHNELKEFYTSLSKCSSKPAILSVIDEFSLPYIPKFLAPDLPPVLSDLYNQDLQCAQYLEILQHASTNGIIKSCSVSANQQVAVEKSTRSQANSKLWFRMRTGRITASRFKAACNTNPACPAKSLIFAICYPEMAKFRSKQTTWGCNHEKIAREKYNMLQQTKHQNFDVANCGLFISTDHGFMGASPDGVVSCTCCGDGMCEIKVIMVCKKVVFNNG